MFSLIVLVFVLPAIEVDSARLTKVASEHSQQSVYWEEQLKHATISGSRTMGGGRPDVRFTYSIDDARSCVHFKNESPKDGEALETVSVVTPQYLFRLIKKSKDSAYHIDSLELRDDSESNKATARIDFRKILEMEVYSHSATRAFDISVAEILNQNDWRVEGVQDTTGENGNGDSTSNVKVTAKSSLKDDFYDKVSVILSPKNRYAVVSYEIHHKPEGLEGEYKSVKSGAVTYVNHDSESYLAQVSINQNTEGNGESFGSQWQATFDSFSSDCDEAVFTLSHYGLSDSLLEKPTNNRVWYLIAAVLSGSVCVVILVQRFRSNGQAF